MAYYPTESRIGLLGFANVDTVTAVPFGTIVRGQDTASGKGAGEFIYLPGVAATKVGTLVTYNSAGSTASTTITPHTANLGQPVAVAMAAVATTKNFGWYQIAGVAAVRKLGGGTVNPNVAIFISGTAGSVQATASAGKQILNARSVNAATVASATSTLLVQIDRPFMQGQIT